MRYIYLFVFSVLSVLSYAQMNAPYQDETLAKYCSDPNRLLVIETKQGTMKIQLFDKVAPNHVKQIVALASEGKYNGTTFHRCIKDFMIHGGDANCTDADVNNDSSRSMGPTLKAERKKVRLKRVVGPRDLTNDVGRLRGGADIPRGRDALVLLHRHPQSHRGAGRAPAGERPWRGEGEFWAAAGRLV